MATHPAVTINGIKQPLTIEQASTHKPQQSEVQVRVEWTPSAPLDVYQVDVGLMAQFPQSLGDSGADTVVAVGPAAKRLKVGDPAFGFFFHNEKEKGQQVYVTASEHLFGKTGARGYYNVGRCDVANELLHSISNLGTPILVWGAGSSVGQFAVQILKYWGYTNVITSDKIKGYGAKHAFDYRDPGVVDLIRTSIGNHSSSNNIHAFDCVDSKFVSLLPISKIATQSGSVVAAVLPVVISGSSDSAGLQLSADVSSEAAWASGVEVHVIVSYTYVSSSIKYPTLSCVPLES
ncbi:hypothetical protein BBP40_007406 [Aspergillus hancockii]|nr:hypothetical protein BBP40_007406 [Aspergillus hancockii]